MIDLGTFTQGEKPVPLVYTFLDGTGAPIDLLNYDAEMVWAEEHGTPTSGTATVTDHAAGETTYVWTGAEFAAPGTYLADLWVGNGVQRFASERITWKVCAAVGPAPSI